MAGENKNKTIAEVKQVLLNTGAADWLAGVNIAESYKILCEAERIEAETRLIRLKNPMMPFSTPIQHSYDRNFSRCK